jgi:hypothetical protein
MKAMNNKLRNNTVAIVMMLLLPVLFGTAQAGAVTYGNKYQAQSTMYPEQGTMPQVEFQSTSAYSEQWSEQATPLLNGDGSVNQEAYMSGSIGPRRSGSDSGSSPGTPDDDEENEGEQQPLGDALLPLTLLACAYLSMRVFLKKRVTRRRTTIEP